MRITVLNGPNLNLLGAREESHYGNFTLADLETKMRAHLASRADVSFYQSNHEGDIVTEIQKLSSRDRLILNAGAFTHTSIAIRDALAAVKVPFIEVHISNVYAREKFRHVSYLSAIAKGVVAGLGAESYLLAADFFLRSGVEAK